MRGYARAADARHAHASEPRPAGAGRSK
jgi:hypothetical protein